MSDKNSSLKKEFLKNEIWILAWAGASQRANIFPKDMDEKSRILMRAEIKKLVFKDFAQFELLERISGDLVIDKISYLVKRFNNSGISFNVGHAQKLINLLLKYYWCSGWLKNEPPHCPIDRIILTKAKIKDDGGGWNLTGTIGFKFDNSSNAWNVSKTGVIVNINPLFINFVMLW